MSLRIDDHKDLRGAYKERQKVFARRDYRNSKFGRYTKPWKTSKGWGTASGHESCPGRNYGAVWEERPRLLAWLEKEVDFGALQGYDEDVCADDTTQESPHEAKYDLEENEDNSFEMQLAKALSLSLAAVEISQGAVELNEDLLAFQEDIELFRVDTDGYSLMDPEEAESMDTTFGYEGDVSSDTEWVDVGGIRTSLERPTYAQMAKIEVT